MIYPYNGILCSDLKEHLLPWKDIDNIQYSKMFKSCITICVPWLFTNDRHKWVCLFHLWVYIVEGFFFYNKRIILYVFLTHTYAFTHIGKNVEDGGAYISYSM